MVFLSVATWRSAKASQSRTNSATDAGRHSNSLRSRAGKCAKTEFKAAVPATRALELDRFFASPKKKRAAALRRGGILCGVSCLERDLCC